MKYVKDMKDGDNIRDVYLCRKKEIGKKQSGDDYFALTLTDKTGTIDGKIWNTANPAVGEFDGGDYVYIEGFVKMFNQRPQITINRLRKCQEGEYDENEYLPTSDKDIPTMYREVMAYIKSVQNPYLHKLLESIFIEDKVVAKAFSEHSAAKTIHHAFKGGLLEHSLSVTKLCAGFADNYPFLNRDLLISAAMMHDVGKLIELSNMPENDYTDEGQLLGHIYMGAEFVSRKIDNIPDFPQKLKNEVLHCILAHHGELEYGSPKKPALAEAMALSMADNLDAKMETLKELFSTAGDEGWLGFQKSFESNVRKTSTWTEEN